MFPHEKKIQIERYHALTERVKAVCKNPDRVFRELELRNGFVYILDRRITSTINEAIKQKVRELNGKEARVDELPDPQEVIADYQKLLGEYVIEQMRNGRDRFDVAMYTKASGPEIVITGRSALNPEEMLAVRYRSFPLLVEDIMEVNKQYLNPIDLKISKIKPGEILPSRQGISFTLQAEKLPAVQQRQMPVPEKRKTAASTVNSPMEPPADRTVSRPAADNVFPSAHAAVRVYRVLNATDEKYHIICAGKEFDIGQGREVGFVLNGRTYQASMHKTTPGRIGKLAQCFKENNLHEGDEIELTFDPDQNKIFAVIRR